MKNALSINSKKLKVGQNRNMVQLPPPHTIKEYFTPKRLGLNITFVPALELNKFLRQIIFFLYTCAPISVYHQKEVS